MGRCGWPQSAFVLAPLGPSATLECTRTRESAKRTKADVISSPSSFATKSTRTPLGHNVARDLIAGFLAVPGGGRDAAFAQLVFGHLAVLGHRQRVDIFQIARHGEVGHAR